MSTMPSTIAFDPGYDRLGWAVGYLKPHLTVVAHGCITPPKSEFLTERYAHIHAQVDQLFSTYQPNSVAIESLFFNKNVSTAIKVAEVRGILIALGLAHHAQIAEYTPSQIKLAATGYGKATKAAVTKMVSLQLKIQTTNLLDDTIDALAILITHAALANRRVI